MTSLGLPKVSRFWMSSRGTQGSNHLVPVGDQITSVPCGEESHVRKSPTFRGQQVNFSLRDLALVAICIPAGNYLYPLLGNDDYSHAFERSFFQLIPLAVIAVIWWSRYMANPYPGPPCPP
jgi:hypothetical protein